jgi:hypothetical protein
LRLRLASGVLSPSAEARAAYGIGFRQDTTPPFRRRIALPIAAEMVAIRGTVLAHRVYLDTPPQNGSCRVTAR